MLAYEALPLLTAKWAKKSFASSMSAIEILRQQSIWQRFPIASTDVIPSFYCSCAAALRS